MINKLLRKNSKGIAMITIMITITFLAIISTTLLYISATNYAMKAANAQGKNNFYETDAQLVQLSVGIRQNVMRTATNPTTGISDFAGSAADTYSITKIVNKAYGTTLSGTDTQCTMGEYTFKAPNNTITVTNHPTVANTKRYVFNDIEVIHTNAKGYTNSVKSDFTIDVFEAQQNNSGGGGGVGSMSMLLDSPMSTNGENFSCLTMAGNSYMAKYDGVSGAWDDGNTYIKPGAGALKMESQARINLYGDYNVVYGDVELSDSSTLAVYGNLTVFGNISVSDNASIVLGNDGKIFQYVDTALPGRGTGANDTNPDHVCQFDCDANHIYPSSATVQHLTKQDYIDFCTLLNLKNTSSSEYGLIYKIFKKNPVDKNGSTPSGLSGKILMDLQPTSISPAAATGLDNTDFDKGRGYFLNSSIYGLEPFGLGFIEYNTDTSSMNGGYDYRLMMSFNNQPLKLQQATVYTTWICKDAVTFKQHHTTTLSKLGTVQFNYMTAGKGDNESKCYDNDLNPFNDISINFGGTTFNGKFGAFFNADCNTSIDSMFGIAGGSGGGGTSTPVYASSMSFGDYERDFQ